MYDYMKTTRTTAVSLFIGALLCAWAPALWATGFRVPDQDAFATGCGEAVTATADNPSAIYFNPAGITQLEGQNLRGGIYGLYLDPSYKSPVTGRSFDNENLWHAVPQVFYTYGFETLPISLGLGVYSPFGLSLRWPQDTGFRTVATQSEVTYATINPVVAWRILTNLSVAAGLKVNYGAADLQQGIVWPTTANDLFRFKGDGWSVGYNLGVLWKPIEQVSLGAAFKSASTIDMEGHTEYYNNVPYGPVPAFPQQTVDANAKFNFPLSANFGISYRPTPKWNFEFDAEMTDWSCLGTVTIHQAQPFLLSPTGSKDLPFTLNWESSWYYEFGATRYFDNGWHVSAGYIYNENSVPDAHYTPWVTDLDRHFLSIGTGYNGQRLQFRRRLSVRLRPHENGYGQRGISRRPDGRWQV